MCCWQAKEKAFDKVDEMDIQRRQAQILAEQVAPARTVSMLVRAQTLHHCSPLLICLSVYLSIVRLGVA